MKALKNKMRDDFLSSASDYLFLLNKGYPETPSVRLVGDRYRLPKEERTMLFRGLCPGRKARERRQKLSESPCASELHIDGYNVLFTILNYRQGRRLFVGSDGYLRDAGGLHGRVGDQDLFAEIAGSVLEFLRGRGVESAYVYLDAPVSRSGGHAALIRESMAGLGLRGGCEVCASADGRLKALRPDCAATSDTGIIDAMEGRIYDLARDYLEEKYAAEFFRFPPPEAG